MLSTLFANDVRQTLDQFCHSVHRMFQNVTGPAQREGKNPCWKYSTKDGRINMRTIFLVLISACLIAAQAQPQTSAEGLSCFENLAAPEYPRAALQGNVDGSVWTRTQVSPQGMIEKIETEVVSAWGNGPKLLTPPVEKAIRIAKINSECVGKTVSVTFR